MLEPLVGDVDQLQLINENNVYESVVFFFLHTHARTAQTGDVG